MSQIKILFDANPLVKQKTGVGYYTEGVIKALSKLPNVELVGHYFKPKGNSPDLPKANNLSYSSISRLTGQIAKALRKIGIRLPWELLVRQKADILFFPDFTSWPSFFKTPKILTIHDLTFVDHPEFVTKANLRYLRRYVKRDVQNAALILTVSNISKKRIVDEFSLPSKKILVEPIPPPETIKADTDLSLSSKFILFLGTVEPRKNLLALLEAYEHLPEKLKEGYSLVIAGGEGWHSEKEMARIKEAEGSNQNVKYLGYVGDKKRAQLYLNASVVVVPSFYEGFGMPILEAMSYGAPVIVSDIPVFKEVAAEGALYFDPKSVESLKSCLAKVLDDEDLRKSLGNRGLVRAKSYNWETVANDIHEQIKLILGRQ